MRLKHQTCVTFPQSAWLDVQQTVNNIWRATAKTVAPTCISLLTSKLTFPLNSLLFSYNPETVSCKMLPAQHAAVNLTAEPTSYAERWTPALDEGFSHTWRLLISKQPPGDGAAPWWRLVPSKPPQVKWLNLLHDELSPLVAAQGLGKVGESCVLIQLGEVMRECRCLLAPRS